MRLNHKDFMAKLSEHMNLIMAHALKSGDTEIMKLVFDMQKTMNSNLARRMTYSDSEKKILTEDAKALMDSGMSVANAARHLNVNQATLNNWLNGRY